MATSSDPVRGRMPHAAPVAALCLAASLLCAAAPARGMGGRPADNAALLETAQPSDATLQSLGALFWPDSNATEAQREEALRNVLGRRVTWTVIVAEVQRQGDAFLVQGSSDANMIGTFSLVTPRDEAERRRILALSRGDALPVTGVVREMRLRHIVLDPARAAFDSGR